MIFTQSLHNHTTFDDGKNTPAEMAAAAFDLGLAGLGLTAHSPMENEFWTVTPERMAEYRAELARLKTEYAGRLNVWRGLEYDLTSDRKWLDGFDYVIASVHALETTRGLWALDDNRERSRRMIVIAFEGDRDAAAEAYFAKGVISRELSLFGVKVGLTVEGSAGGGGGISMQSNTFWRATFFHLANFLKPLFSQAKG